MGQQQGSCQPHRAQEGDRSSPKQGRVWGPEAPAPSFGAAPAPSSAAAPGGCQKQLGFGRKRGPAFLIPFATASPPCSRVTGGIPSPFPSQTISSHPIPIRTRATSSPKSKPSSCSPLLQGQETPLGALRSKLGDFGPKQPLGRCRRAVGWEMTCDQPRTEPVPGGLQHPNARSLKPPLPRRDGKIKPI